jgi:hypothetical protein
MLKNNNGINKKPASTSPLRLLTLINSLYFLIIRNLMINLSK